MRPLARVPVQLKGIFWGSDMRWFLRGAEIWLGNEYLGDVSGEWLADQVAQQLAALALTKRFQLELEPHRVGAPASAAAPAHDFKRAKRRARHARSKSKPAAS